MIAWGRYDERFGIMAVDINTDKTSLLRYIPNIDRSHLSPHRKRLVIQGTDTVNPEQTYLIDIQLDSLATKRLTPDYSEFLTWSPDSNWVFYMQYPNPEGYPVGIYRVKIDGKESQIITDSLSDTMQVSPDGEWVLLEDYQAPITIIHVDKGQSKDLLQNFSSVYFEKWSADNQWIIFSSTDEDIYYPHLYRVNINTGAVEKLTNFPNGAGLMGLLNTSITWHRGWLLGLAGLGVALGLWSLRFGIPQFRQNGV